MRAPAVILVIVAGCSGSTRGADPPPPPQPQPQPQPAPQDAHAAPPPAIDAGAAADRYAHLYQDGKPFRASNAYEAQFTCKGSDEARDACAAMHPKARCVLEPPVGYWAGEIRCKGTRVTEWEMQAEEERRNALGIPPCECSCDPAWMAADERYRARLEECSNVP
jgi:hypothetical protein